MNTFLMLANGVAGAAVLWFACEELGEKRRLLNTPSAWIYAAMALAALAVMLLQPFEFQEVEVFFKVVVAMHFVRKLWQGRLKRQAAAAQKPKPHIRLSAKR